MRSHATAPCLVAACLALALAGCGGPPAGAPPSAGATAPAGAGSTAPAGARHPPRHVFLITVDTLRADHTSLHGYDRPTTPHLVERAAAGVVFERAIAQWPKTGASFASLFTGRYPHTTGLTHKAVVRIPESYLTLPELMQEAGYATVAVQSNPVLAAKFGWSAGFDEYLETWGGLEIVDDAVKFRPFAQAPKVNALALPLLARHEKDARLFVWLHYCDPHAPYLLPPGETNPFLDAPFPGDRPLPKKVEKVYALSGHDDLRFHVAQYDANVRVADRAVAQALDEARRLGLLDDSLIVFAADHGESLGEHDSWFEHGPLPYNTTARVPLVLLGTGFTAGRRVDRPVEMLDVYPTLRDLVAPARAVDGLEGRSLLPLLAGPLDAPAARAFERAYSSAGERPNYFNSVQDGAWKLVFNAGGKRSRAIAAATAGFELYDLLRDPLETRNVAAANTEELRRLRHVLTDWMQQAQASGEEEPLDPETAKALRALGYIR